MLEFKRKYLAKSLEPLAIFGWTRYYSGTVMGNYFRLHKIRSFLSPIGINGFILGYIFLALILILEEILIGDPATRNFMLIALATHALYDLLLNLEVFYLGNISETKNYTSELLVCEDRLTFEQRIHQLKQQDRPQELKQIQRIAQNAHGLDRLTWIGGIRIREKGTGSCWSIRITEENDYESHMKKSNKPDCLSCVLPVFQEVRDRNLSAKRRQQILRRLERNGIYIKPCYSQEAVPASLNT